MTNRNPPFDGPGRPVAVQDGENVPGLPARVLSPDVFVRPLSSSPGQSRRTHFKVFPGKSRTRLSLQFSVIYNFFKNFVVPLINIMCPQGERGLRSGGRAGPADRTARRGRHLLRELQDDPRLEICKFFLNFPNWNNFLN